MTDLFVAQSGSGAPLVLLHGWGMQSNCWGNFADELSESFKVYRIDLPGHGQSRHVKFVSGQQLIQQLLNAAPSEPCHWLGWSLGGELALQIADLYPNRVQRLIMLASNPCFIAQADWPGVSEQWFEGFASQASQHMQKTLQRFVALQCHGAVDAKQQMHFLRNCLKQSPIPETTALLCALQLLQQLDLRSQWQHLQIPVLNILGEHDRLVPASLARQLQKLNDKARVAVLGGTAHLPFYSHKTLLIDMIKEFTR